MTPAILLGLVLQYGPSIIPLVASLVQMIKSGKGDQPLTEADWALLIRYGNQKADDYITADGGTPPPAPPTPTQDPTAVMLLNNK